ncbi:hypothetical protein L7F22_066952 [Adiantum nelumboides]|nr:hypothetical protein [Adiantum nelumboides]
MADYGRQVLEGRFKNVASGFTRKDVACLAASSTSVSISAALLLRFLTYQKSWKMIPLSHRARLPSKCMFHPPDLSLQVLHWMSQILHRSSSSFCQSLSPKIRSGFNVAFAKAASLKSLATMASPQVEQASEQKSNEGLYGLRHTVWDQQDLRPVYPKISKDEVTDVVIVGAGISGLSVAYNLVKEGKKVVILEAKARGKQLVWLQPYFIILYSSVL